MNYRPHYELFLLIRRLSKDDLKGCLTRTANFIFDNNGVLRKIENLGTRNLPYKLKTPNPGQPNYTSANYFLMHFDIPPSKSKELNNQLALDLDVLKHALTPKQPKVPPFYVCTLEEELLPPVFRPSVQTFIQESRKKKKELTIDYGDDIFL